MSTNIDLGKIKFQWKGNWDSTTNFTVDDVVNHDGNTWVCVQNALGNAQIPEAGSAYWEVMVQGSDLATISGLTVGDIVYWDGTNFVRLAYPLNPTNRFLTANTNTGPTWVELEPHIIQTVHYEHYNGQSVGNGSYYYWGRSGTYDVSITTIKANSYIKLNMRIFGEPSGHNAHGRMYMAVNDGNTAGFNYLQMPNFGQNGHLKLAPYEYTGDYNSTPYQNNFETVINTSSFGSATKFSFRLYVFNGQTMRFNQSYNSAYESGPSSITLTELNNANTTLVRTGSPTGSY